MVDSVADVAEKSGLTVETLKAAVDGFTGHDPVLTVGNQLYLYAVRICQYAYGPGFREKVGIAIVGHGEYGWELRDRLTFARR